MAKKAHLTKKDPPAENKSTVTQAANEDSVPQNSHDLNDVNQVYNTTGAPDATETEGQQGLSKYENWGSEFGADPEAAGRLNAQDDENEHVTHEHKNETKDTHSR